MLYSNDHVNFTIITLTGNSRGIDVCAPVQKLWGCMREAKERSSYLRLFHQLNI